MRRVILVLGLALAACTSPPPAAPPPSAAPRAKPEQALERFWTSLRTRDEHLFKTVFSARKSREMARDGWKRRLDGYIEFPRAVLELAHGPLDPEDEALLERWNERIPVEQFSYRFEGGEAEGVLYAYLPLEHAERVPFSVSGPLPDGRVLIWDPRVVYENGAWKLDEH